MISASIEEDRVRGEGDSKALEAVGLDIDAYFIVRIATGELFRRA